MTHDDEAGVMVKSPGFRYKTFNSKKRRKRCKTNGKSITENDVINSIEMSRQLLMDSQFYMELKESLQKHLSTHSASVVDIVCYGIGSIESSILSRYQLALALLLRELLQRGQRVISQPTLFFMPHCPLSLYDNVLSANWEKHRLEQLIMIGNRFDFYEESHLTSLEYPLISIVVNLYAIQRYSSYTNSNYALSHVQILPFPTVTNEHSRSIPSTAFSDTSWQWFAFTSAIENDTTFWDCKTIKEYQDPELL
ncbi:2186_t:CDS:2 [Paraglomus brasilianum]|uniref:2186_t:CDS:1 n=1 Tax=Paraglomus brasilianum TaxID=144538 RepID=A0A9N9C7X6_9GLOM|nr:2186_t:CDS:2 [Paraglomus brasilianum]